MTDMSKYAGSAFLKLDDVRDGPRRGKIVQCSISEYDRPQAVMAVAKIDRQYRVKVSGASC
jgi:hypothetical protein